MTWSYALQWPELHLPGIETLDYRRESRSLTNVDFEKGVTDKTSGQTGLISSSL